eukprot:m.55880 g.55880  ORF g.55880 m.55880 type:complete len:88 (+) comp34512_c0_seq2:101-364(+)
MLQSRIDRVDSFRKKVCSETHQLQGNAAIAAAWNLDGTRLAVASDDKVLEIWDAATPGWKSLNSRSGKETRPLATIVARCSRYTSNG